MPNLTHHEPYESQIDDLLHGYFMRPVVAEKSRSEPIKMDVTENETGYLVKAELPGIRKDDITVTIDRNQVTITAETHENKEEKKGEKVLRRERFFGRMSRSFTLADEVDESQANASFDNGVLVLNLPRKLSSQGKRLPIS